MEVSALTGENVRTCFETVANLMFKHENENLQNNTTKSKKKFKVDNGNVTLNKSVELSKENFKLPKKNNCC